MITTIEELKREVESTIQSSQLRIVDIAKGSGVNDTSIGRYRDGYGISDGVNLFALADFFNISYRIERVNFFLGLNTQIKELD